MSPMKPATLLIACALCLGLSTPSFAQRASLADRVAALEQQAAGNSSNIDLLNQVTQLKNEIQALRSQIEELQHQQAQDKDTTRAQYLDIDGRLNRLEGGAPAPASPASIEAPPDAGAAVIAPDSTPAYPADAAPAVYGDAGSLAKGANERDAYDAAFDALKAGRYADSAQLFQGFLMDYPGGAYAPNALYWLGESYYVTQNYELAQAQFETLRDRYPTHDKAPGALLKIGLAQYGLQQFDAAEATLSDVTARYPGTDAARTAEDRLRAIQLGRLR